MIVTFTANPSIDRTVEMTSPLQVGRVNRTSTATEQAAGKGINVAAALAANGVAVTAVAAFADEVFADLVSDSGFPVGWARTMPVRTNLTVVCPDGTTKLNEPGPHLEDVSDITDLVLEVVAATDAQWLVMSGALPPGAPTDWYAQLAQRVATLGVRIAVDATGAPLAEVLACGAPVEFIKPNIRELAEATGRESFSLEDAGTEEIVTAARELIGQVREVLVSRGADGAVLVTAEEAWVASAPEIVVRSTVGAGDAMVAGYVWARDQSLEPQARLDEAVRWGSAAASLSGTTAPVVLSY